MKNKIKFSKLTNIWSHSILEKDMDKVVNPTSYKNLPDGEYLIRGNKKDHSKTYWVVDSIWYLIEDKVKDNGHYCCNASKYLLFPQLSEKEWEVMNKIPYKRLTKYWRRARYGYNFYMELRQLRRNRRKALNRLLKSYESQF